MSFKRNFLLSLLSLILPVAMVLAPSACAADSPSTPLLSFEEILAKRKVVREELMLPSLEGIRGLAYRVVGYKDYEPLERAMGLKLANLNMPTVRFVEMKEGQKPVDAIVQVTFFKVANFNVAELSVYQWVSLLRDPSKKVRAITYKDRLVVPHGKPLLAVEALTNDFVIDTLKANQKSTAGNTSTKADDKKPKEDRAPSEKKSSEKKSKRKGSRNKAD
ncbi:MAG: hypothetical protein K2W95_13285 [Candidatus Obscuribacterales bacterium]|nr:hypothetical protein [Candidatus Obscuribacterales bacterium]